MTSNAITQYPIGEIPDQTAYHGYTREFQLYVQSAPGVADFAMAAEPPPAGALWLDPATGEFAYTPAATDRSPFQITFSGGGASQRVMFSPAISLPAEADIFPGTQPEPDPTEYTSWQEEIVLADVEINGIVFTPQGQPARKVFVSGMKVIFDRSIPASPGAVYGNPNETVANSNIQEINITADTVVIRDELRFPQTNVVIKARELRFEDKEGAPPACIVTMPVDRAGKGGDAAWKRDPYRPTQSQIDATPPPPSYFDPVNDIMPAEDGKPGYNGGSITLNIAQFHSNGDTPVVRFNTAGGKGQAPGKGKDGIDALDITSKTDIPWMVKKEGVSVANPVADIKYLDGVYVDFEGLIPWTRVANGSIANFVEMRVVRWLQGFTWLTEHQWIFRAFKWEKNGPVITPPPAGCKPLWWLCGLDAIPPGRPGNGGNTGTVASTLDLQACCHFEGGAPGATVVDAQGAPAVYRGGLHGMRNYVQLGEKDQGWRGDVTRYNGYSYYEKQWLAPWEWHGNYIFYNDGSGLCPCGCGQTYAQLMQPYTPNVEYYRPVNGQPRTAHAGQPGSGAAAFVLLSEPGQSDWLSAGGMRRMLQYIEDLYLAGRVETVRLMLEYYIQAMAPEDGDSEMRQLLAEMLVLHHRASNNLDYFGNPAGWTPMLSFEANMAAFENEIDSAIETLYLTYWLSNKSQDLDKRIAALEYAMNKLSDEMDEFIDRYLAAQEAVPGIEASAADISRKIDARRASLMELEERLVQLAQENIDRDAWKRNIKVASAALDLVPGMSPLFGAIGKGLEILTTIDSQSPWDTAGAYTELAATTLAGGLGDTSKALGNALAIVKEAKEKDDKDKPKSGEENTEPHTKAAVTVGLMAAQMVVGQVQGEANRVAKAVGPLVTAIKTTQVGHTEVQAELQRLKASHPAFGTIVRDIQDLLNEKQLFAAKLAATLQEMTTAANGVTQTALAIIAVHEAKSSALAIVDERATAYLDEMQRRARNRLLKYQYYMAKAFEYRMLKPYTGRLNLNRLFDAFLNLAELSGEAGIENGGGHLTHRLSPDEFNLLKNIYVEELRRVMAVIFDELNTNAPERSVPVAFALTEEELRQLNLQGAVTINLKQKNIFGRTEENIRICDLRTQSMHVRPPDGADYGGTALLRVKYEHSGRSLLDSRGKTYSFNHYTTAPVNPISWKTVYDGITGQMTETRISAASNSLLGFLLSSQGRSTDNLLLYSRPGAWADIVITKESVTGSGANMIIDALRLEVEYDYFEKRNDLFDLAVNVSDALMPTILLETPFKSFKTDVNGRGDGRGSFVRVFNPNDTVRLEAPAVYGTWVFDRWEDATGRVLKSLGGSVHTTVTMNGHKRLQAVYVNTVETTPPDQPVILTNNGHDFTTSFNTYTIAGTVGYEVEFVEVNGAALPNYVPGSGYWEAHLTFTTVGASVYSVVAYDGALTASEPATITITYNPFHITDPIDPMPADLSLSTTLVVLSPFAPSVTIDVINLGDLPLHWTASSEDPGVTVSPAGPTNAGTLTIAAPFFSEVFTATVTVENMGDPDDFETIAVVVERGPLPANLQVSSNLMVLTETAPSADFNILNLGEVPLTWTIEASSPNILVSQWSGTGPATVTVTGYDFTTATVALTVRNLVDPADFEVLLVQMHSTPASGSLAVSTSLILLTETMPWATFNIVNLGPKAFNWNITPDAEGLLFEPQAGYGDTTVTVAATDFLNDTNIALLVQNTDNPAEIKTVTVRVRRTPAPAILAVSAHTLVLAGHAPSASFDVINRGDLPLLWEVSCDSTDVSIDPVWGQNTATVTITADEIREEKAITVTVENSANRSDARTVIVQLQPLPPGCFAIDSSASLAQASAGDLLLLLGTISVLGAMAGLSSTHTIRKRRTILPVKEHENQFGK